MAGACCAAAFPQARGQAQTQAQAQAQARGPAPGAVAIASGGSGQGQQAAPLVPPPYPTPIPGPYALGPDSQPQPDVPKGRLEKDTLPPGKIYPGVPHEYQVYIPASYDPSRPAPVMIFADGIRSFCGNSLRTPTVFDNLIAKKELPPLVGIFVDPGVMPPLDPETQQARFNRTFEYDEVDDRFARFLIDELLPAAAAKYRLNLSANPSDRAVAGISTGAVGAFMAAWTRPDQFRRVLSFIGTFVDMKGANNVPFLIRKTEPRPLRVFLQDGANDQNSGWGSWFQQNQAMDWALTLMNYDHTFITGTDGHSTAQGGAILPDALRWLWRGYPAAIDVPPPVAAGVDQDPSAGGGPALRPATFNIVSHDAGWEPVGGTYASAASPAGDKEGNVYFADPRGNAIYKAGADGHVTPFARDTAGAQALRVGPDGRLYAAQPARKRIVSYSLTSASASAAATPPTRVADAPAAETLVARDVDAHDFVLTSTDAIYFSDTSRRRIMLIAPRGAGAAPTVAYDSGADNSGAYEGGAMAAPAALALSPDHSRLEVMDARSKFGWSFQIAKDGSLVSGQPFWRLESSEQTDMTGVGGVAVDALGYLYIPTILGIELSNQIGRVEHILNAPDPASTITHVAFGGADRTWLYATTTAGTVYRRHLKRAGVAAWLPVKPPAPRL
jgi:enterochelin esterase-like enzyme/sugar lactone lactonase YvrE